VIESLLELLITVFTIWYFDHIGFKDCPTILHS